MGSAATRTVPVELLGTGTECRTHVAPLSVVVWNTVQGEDALTKKVHAALLVERKVVAATPWAADRKLEPLAENPGVPPPPKRCGSVQCTPSWEETSHRSAIAPTD